MQIRLLDILADPDDPSRWPLKLEVLESTEHGRSDELPPHKETGLLCKFYCAREDTFLVSNPLQENEETLSKDKIKAIATFDKCKKCIQEEIVNGVLYYEVEGEKKWFIVDREIPVMYGRSERDKKQEQAFFEKFPDVFARMGLSWNYL